jgi:hypothetical protein
MKIKFWKRERELIMKKTMVTKGTFVLEQETKDSNINFNVQNQLEEMWESAELVVKCSDGLVRTFKVSDLSADQWIGLDVDGIEVEEEVTQEELAALELI